MRFANPRLAADNALLKAACARGDVAAVRALTFYRADVNDNKGEALLIASTGGHLEIVKILVNAGVNMQLFWWDPYRAASDAGHEDVAHFLMVRSSTDYVDDECIAKVEADLVSRRLRPTELIWRKATRAWPRLCIFVKSPYALPGDDLRACWFWVHVHLYNRLRPAIQRARYRLDRPPTSELGTTRPTREQLIAHLRTGGKRFAREYWTEGLPLFFPGQVEELGAVPREFV